MSRHYPIFTLLLSPLPGLAHLYLGDKKKALSLLVIDAGIILTLVFSDSLLMKGLMLGIYIIAFLPAAVETYQLAAYDRRLLNTNAKWYVIIMLLTTGFSALPLLWQSNCFGRTGKTAWSIAVPVLATLFFFFLSSQWDDIEHWLQTLVHS